MTDIVTDVLVRSKPLKPIIINSNFKRIAVISDLHFPFESTKVTDEFIRYCAKFRPKYIVVTGDIYDFFSHSRFPHSMNEFTPAEEVNKAYTRAKMFLKNLQEVLYQPNIYLLLGNHDLRPMKRLLESYPEGEVFFSFEKFYTFKKCKTIFDTRQELIINKIMFMHGYSCQPGKHCQHNMMNTVVGHSHVGGVWVRNTANGILWELNSGMAADPSSKGLGWTSQTIQKFTPGFGSIDEFGCRFIPVKV